MASRDGPEDAFVRKQQSLEDKMQRIHAYLPKENTLFTLAVCDGVRRSRNESSDLMTSLYLRVEAAALPIIAAIDAFLQASVGAIQAVIGLVTLDSFPTFGTIASAMDHIQLAGQSLLAIPVAIQGALQALVDPRGSFDSLADAIKRPEKI